VNGQLNEPLLFIQIDELNETLSPIFQSNLSASA
jgi:hypothetical protein